MPLNLGAVADDAGVVHHRRNLLGVEAGNLLGIEIGEGGAEGVALAQDRDPRKAGLEPVEDQFLEQCATIELRHAPFLVVVGDIERVCAWPGAAHQTVGIALFDHLVSPAEDRLRHREAKLLCRLQVNY